MNGPIAVGSFGDQAEPAGPVAVDAMSGALNAPIRLPDGRTACNGGWNAAIRSIREALSDVDRAGRLIVAALVEAHADAVACAKKFDQSVADTRAEGEAAMQRAQIEREVEVAELRATIERYRAQLQVERSCRLLPSELQPGSESTAADRVPPRAGQSEIDTMRSALDAARLECVRLSTLLQEERARRVRLIDAVRSVRDSKSGPLQFSAASEPRPARTTSEPPPDAVVDRPSARDVDPMQTPVDASPCDGGQPAVDDLGFDPAAYGAQLFDSLEAVYESDAGAGLSPDVLVERLVHNLAYAAATFSRRVGPGARGHNGFDQQLTAVLETKGDTSFGRHLAFAAYEFEQQRKRSAVA